MSVVSLVGRPNTGKSALFNRIAKKRVAIVFDQPGVTRDRVTREVDVCGRKVMLVDTAGMKPHTKMSERKGDWQVVNTERSSVPCSGRVFQLWIDHGKAPQGASVRYEVLP